MKILAIADEESPSLWDYYSPGKLEGYRMILSCGDLKPEYLSFLVTMARCPLFYVHGNHDGRYEKNPPEGCDCIDDKLIVYQGLRILGLGGSLRYSQEAHQYTQRQMAWRIFKLKRAIRAAGGVDIVLAHCAPRGVGDMEDLPHRGFESFLTLLDQYQPQYLLHGHVHMSYGHKISRIREYGNTQVVNCCEKYPLEVSPTGTFQAPKGLKKLYTRLFIKNLEIWDV